MTLTRFKGAIPKVDVQKIPWTFKDFYNLGFVLILLKILYRPRPKLGKLVFFFFFGVWSNFNKLKNPDQ